MVSIQPAHAASPVQHIPAGVFLPLDRSSPSLSATSSTATAPLLPLLLTPLLQLHGFLRCSFRCCSSTDSPSAAHLNLFFLHMPPNTHLPWWLQHVTESLTLFPCPSPLWYKLVESCTVTPRVDRHYMSCGMNECCDTSDILLFFCMKFL